MNCRKEDVDARDKRGHDEKHGVIRCPEMSLIATMTKV
jgi:hypothetical protein